MAKINLTGLRGLAGLSNNERQSFLESHGLTGQGLTFQQKDRAYRDYLYQQYFGVDSAMPSDPDERDKALFNSIVQEAFDERYKGVASDDEYNLWNSLSMEGKYDLLNSNILTEQQITDLEESNRQAIQRQREEMQKVKDDNWFVNAMMSSDPMATIAWYYAEEAMIDSNRENNEEKLKEIFDRDKQNVLGKAAPIAAQLYDQWQEAIDDGQMDYQTINQEFNKIAPYLNHYKAFQGEEELKNFSTEDKMNAVAQYYAIMQQTGDAGVALNAVDGGIQNYISGQQDGWDKTKLFLGNLVTGTVGAILNEVNGLLAIGAGGVGAAFGDSFEEGVSDFLSSDWAQYWDGVDNFNTFSPAAINQARENGGVSTNQRIRAIGTEHDIDLNTIYDMGAMAKFIIPALLSKGMVSAATKGFSKLTMSLATRAARSGLMRPTMARTTMNILNGAAGVAGTLESGVGISNAYAMGTYSEVLAENNQKIDQLVDNHVQRQIAEYVAQGGSESDLSSAQYNAVRQRAEQELNVAQLRHEAELAATDAYMVNATMEAPRMALENALFRKWMLSKGTKANLGMENPYLRVANVDGSLTMLNKWQNRLKPILSNVWGGFESNYMDDVTARFGKEWGLANFNNYIAKSYDPTQYAGVVDDYMNPLLAAATGAGEAFGETQSFWDGFIGAGGSLIQLAPSGRWAKRMYQNRQAKKAGIEAPAENRTFLERLNDYVYNPILIEVEEALGRERRTSNRIVEINKYIAENQDKFDDIVNLAIADSRAVFGQRSGDMLTAADEKTYQLFELASLYRKMQDDPIAREHSQMQQMNEMLQKISDSKSIDDVADLVQTSMSRPENQGTHPVTAEETYAAIKDNAERFSAMVERLGQINKMFDETFDPGVVPESLRKQLSYQLVMSENWQERLDKITEELQLSPSSQNNMTAQFGGKKGWEVKQRAQSKVVADINDVIKQEKQDLEDAEYTWKRSRLTGKRKKVKKTGLTEEQSRDISLLKKEIETLERTKQDAQSKLDWINQYDQESSEVISSEQMSSLSLEDLAFMIDPKNAKYYSVAQQTEINKFVDDLVAQDPEASQKIQDAATLQQRIADNKAAYNRLITSPTEAAAWDQEMKLRRQIAIQELYRERRITDAMTDIANLLYQGEQGKSSIPIKYGPDFIQEFIERNPSMEDSMMLLKETAQLISDISNYIALQGLDDAGRRAANQTVYNIAQGATTAAQVVSRLESALASDSLSEFDKSVIDMALTQAEQLGLQRTSTTERSKPKPTPATDTDAPATSTTEATTPSTEAPETAPTVEPGDTVEPVTQPDIAEGETGVSADQVVDTTEDVHTPTPEEVAASESQIEAPDIDSTGSQVEEVSLSEEMELFDALDIPVEDRTSQEELSSKVEGVANPAVDTTEQGNILPEADPEVLPGNKYPGYDYQVATEEGVLVKPTSEKEGDRMDSMHKWLESLGINLQNIIDNELNAILQVQPKIHFMGTKYTNRGDFIYDSLMLVVEYTPEVARIHKEENGGVFSTNGKQYLLVGISGFNLNNAQQGKYYRDLLKQHKVKRAKFFSQNSTEQYFVDESQYTEAKDRTSGRIVRQMSKEEPVQMRRVSDLLVEDPSINPLGINSLGELHWGIQYATEFRLVNEPTTGIVYPPTDASTNVGAVFIMMEAANGNFIPAAISPALYTDLKDGSRLKQRINQLVTELLSPNLSERQRVVNDLMKIFSLNSEQKQILVSNENHSTITFKDGETTVFTRDLNDPNFSSAELLEAFSNFNPRVSITTSVLGNSTLLKMYDQAGALMTDIAKLGTSVSNYTIYPIGPDGAPIKLAPPFNGRPNIDANSDLAKAQAKQGMTQYYKGTQYRKRGNNWFKPGSNEPITGELAEQVQYSNLIRTNQLVPDVTAPGRSYYVMNSDRANPVVVRQNSNGTVRVLDKAESIKVLDHIAKTQEAANREAAIQEALRTEQEGRVPTEQDTLVDIQDVDLTGAEAEVATQLAGDFTNQTNAVEVTEEEPVSETDAESVLSAEDINETTTASMEELQGTKAPDTAAGIAASREWGDRLFEIVEKKVEDGLWEVSDDVLDDYVALTKFLESKGVPTTAISNVEGWLSLIEECK